MFVGRIVYSFFLFLCMPLVKTTRRAQSMSPRRGRSRRSPRRSYSYSPRAVIQLPKQWKNHDDIYNEAAHVPGIVYRNKTWQLVEDARAKDLTKAHGNKKKPAGFVWTEDWADGVVAKWADVDTFVKEHRDWEDYMVRQKENYMNDVDVRGELDEIEGAPSYYDEDIED